MTPDSAKKYFFTPLTTSCEVLSTRLLCLKLCYLTAACCSSGQLTAVAQCLWLRIMSTAWARSSTVPSAVTVGCLSSLGLRGGGTQRHGEGRAGTGHRNKHQTVDVYCLLWIPIRHHHSEDNSSWGPHKKTDNKDIKLYYQQQNT